MARRSRALVAAGVAFALVAAACGGGGGGTKPGGGTAAVGACPVGALAKATSKPVEITLWYFSVAKNAQVITQLTDAFNASQRDVRVKLVQQPSYKDVFTKWKAALGGGVLPDLVHMEETTVQAMLDSRSTVTMQACVDADHYPLADFLPRAIDYYSTQGVLRAMPWNVSNPVLFYNRTAFRKAGLDPDKPPRTLEEVKAFSEKIVASGAAKHGIALKIEPFYNEFWYAKDGQTYVNNGNGRRARATSANLDTQAGLALWTWWKDMVGSGLALNVGYLAENQPDHLLAVANGNAAMTVEASSVLGPVFDVLGSGQFPGVEMGVGPLPGLQAGGGVPVGDGSLWISAKSSPEKQAAAWAFVKYLVAPAQQAALHVGTGWVPIRMSAIDDPAVKALWAQKPQYRVAYDQLVLGPRSDATSGSVIGDYQGVRDAVRAGLEAMLTGGRSPKDALALAQRQADDAIRAYNQRVGG